MYVCMYAYMLSEQMGGLIRTKHICIRMYVYVCMYIHICVCMYTYIRMYIIRLYVCIRTFVCIYMRMCTCNSGPAPGEEAMEGARDAVRELFRDPFGVIPRELCHTHPHTHTHTHTLIYVYIYMYTYT